MKARAQADLAGDLEALSDQGRARRVAHGRAGAVQRAANARPAQPYRALLADTVSFSPFVGEQTRELGGTLINRAIVSYRNTKHIHNTVDRT
ncbi:MAG: hypothetical protein ACRDTT_24705 [Pseudonocardiaceae bacterium]